MAFSILSAKFGTGDTAIYGVTLQPYVLVKRGEGTGTCTAEDVPEEGVDAPFVLRSRWYRSTITRGGAFCCVHPDKEAAVQCVICLRLRVAQHLSYHCTAECLKSNWNLHKEHHKQPYTNGGPDNGCEPIPKPVVASVHSNGETWIEVGRAREYTPTADDVGFNLKYECCVVSGVHGTEIGRPLVVLASRVRPGPNPPNRAMIPLNLKPASQMGTTGRFSLLTYNLLADLYTKAEGYSNCPPWALSWQYRKQLLLKELLSYRADIMCLQEVQSNHYMEFLAPELQKQGYTPIYKKKTTELYTGSAYAIDGCATFYRKDRFTLVKKYEVEFNKAALSLAEQIQSPQHKKAALNRLLKDNVALIAVLEALDAPYPESGGRNRQLICVANTHIHANPELSDVKLWQVHTLLKGLEKIASSADIPMLVAGDFNSVPGSAAHHLLVKGSVDPSALAPTNDPLGILRELNQQLQHELPLASAYSGLRDSQSTDARTLRQKARLDKHSEPLFTNLYGSFKGTLDYILYTTDYLCPVAVLELPSEAEVQPNADDGMPNTSYPSDHVALLAEFQYIKNA